MNHIKEAKEKMNPSNSKDRHEWQVNKDEAQTHALIAIAEQLEIMNKPKSAYYNSLSDMEDK